MAKKAQKKREFKVDPDSDRRGCLKRAAVTVVVVILILAVFGLFAMRTEMARTSVEEHLERQTGMDLSVERTRIGWPYQLVIEGITTEESEDGPLSGFSAKEIRVGLDCRLKVVMKVKRGIVNLLRIEDGTWRPTFFARLGALRQLEQVADLTKGFRRTVRLEIDRGSILWFDCDGSRIARAEDMDFSMTKVALKNQREMYHCSLSVFSITHEDGGRTPNVKREWFFTDEDRFIEIEHSAETGESPSGHGLWRAGEAGAEKKAPEAKGSP
jgi:hypothetical protein